jgi:hypothetical protein
MPTTQTKDLKQKLTGPVIVKEKAHSSAADREAVRFFFTTPPVPFTKPIYYNVYRLLFKKLLEVRTSKLGTIWKFFRLGLQ